MLFVIGALVVAVIVLLLIIFTRLPGSRQFSELQREINEMKTKQLESANRSLADQSQFYQKSQAMLSAVHQKLGSLEKASEQISELGKDIVQLQDILKAPKLRGGLGEYLLEDLLRQVLPEKNFERQYRFSDGTAVDAVVKVGERLVPIDAKFPLDSFQRMLQAGSEEERGREKKEFVRSVKAKIDDIARKYIKESENTYDFAMMYIPAENVYYETIITDNLQEKKYEISSYALERKVIPVSPNSLYSYLMAIVLGLKGFKIEQQAKLIMNELSKVQSGFADFFSDFTLVGKHLKNASSKYDDSAKKAERFNDRIAEITGIRSELIESKATIHVEEGEG
jgi:DNA recombination protein RmuC